MSFEMGKEKHPATSMTQHAALMFCKWLSAKTGHFYRLPTEAEWEYACLKGGAREKSMHWSKENSDAQYHEIDSNEPDEIGLYNMLGNVAEWTMDAYIDGKSDKGSWAIPKSLYPRVLKGGSWKDTTDKCTCTSRKASKASWKRIDPQLPKSRWWFTNAPIVGFRIVRPYPTPSKEEIEKYWLPVIDEY